ncbi:MAG: hypothetical protein NTX86_02635 [Candidatus Dependentiae bacterium]|nr:hypothetical protein [Candidatus Dependentiae bacterium]
MIKKILLIGLYMAPVVAMDQQKSELSPAKIKLSKACAHDIKNIDDDCLALYVYFNNAFQEIIQEPRLVYSPSELLIFLSTEHSTINRATTLKYMTGSDYVSTIIIQQCDRLDDAFEAKQKKLNNAKMTWQWFDGYFKQKGLIEPLAAYKQGLIEADQEKLKGNSL